MGWEVFGKKARPEEVGGRASTSDKWKSMDPGRSQFWWCCQEQTGLSVQLFRHSRLVFIVFMLFLSHSFSLKLGNEVGECGVLWHDILSVPLGWISIMGWKRAGVIKRSLCKQSCEGQSGIRVECGECEDLAAQPALLECQQCASLRWETAVSWEEVRSRAGDRFLKEGARRRERGHWLAGWKDPPWAVILCPYLTWSQKENHQWVLGKHCPQVWQKATPGSGALWWKHKTVNQERSAQFPFPLGLVHPLRSNRITILALEFPPEGEVVCSWPSCCPARHSHACRPRAKDLWWHLVPPASPDSVQGGNCARWGDGRQRSGA